MKVISKVDLLLEDLENENIVTEAPEPQHEDSIASAVKTCCDLLIYEDMKDKNA